MLLSNNFLSYALAIALAASFGTYFRPDNVELGELLTGVSSFQNAPDAGLKIALGSNVCVDLIAPAKDTLKSMSSSVTANDNALLKTYDDVASTFAHYFQIGAAAERSCDENVFSELVQRASASSYVRRFLGGNAGLMARKLANLGVGAILGGPVGPDAARMLPSGVRLATEQLPLDEVHLILEYGRGESLAGYGTSPRANRFIITADATNTNVDALLATIRAADESGAHALVVAGLHMLEPLERGVRANALAQLAAGLQARKGGYLVHVELASSADPAWTAAIAHALFPLVDSVGFNEQEGAFLFEALGGRWARNATAEAAAAAAPAATSGWPKSITALLARILKPAAPAAGSVDLHVVAGARTDVSGPAPKAVAVAGLLRFLMEQFPSLTRLHFHALALHMTAHRWVDGVAAGGAGLPSKTGAWRGGPGPVATGSMTATTEACRASVEELAASQDKLFATGPLRFNTADPRPGASNGPVVARASVDEPVVTWSWNLAAAADADTAASATSAGATAHSSGSPVHFHLSPVVGCRQPLSTVGLGDAISAAGLAADVAA